MARGANTDRSVVLIHGFPMDSTMWERQRDTLAAHGCQVFTPDLPGFGKSPAWPLERYSIDAMADYVLEYIKGKGLSCPVVGGLSMGGYILFSMLRRHAKDVRAAMLVCTRAAADTPEAKVARMEMLKRIQSDGVQAIASTMADRLLRPNPAVAVKRAVEEMIKRQSQAGVEGALRAMAARDAYTDLLEDIDMPTLVVAGELDQLTPPAMTREMQQAIPDSNLVPIANAGHLAPLEQPEAVAMAMLRFVESQAG